MLRFTTRELLLVTAIAGVAVGWLADHRAADKRLADFKNKVLVTRQFLLDKGFAEGKDKFFKLRPMSIANAAELLGFSRKEMRPTMNSSNPDMRFVRVRNLYFLIESLEKDDSGRVIPQSLDDPDAIAEVSVSLQ